MVKLRAYVHKIIYATQRMLFKADRLVKLCTRKNVLSRGSAIMSYNKSVIVHSPQCNISIIVKSNLTRTVKGRNLAG